MNLGTGLAGTAIAGVGGGSQHFATPIGQDRLVRQEVSLGLVREIVPPLGHIGLQLVPFMDVPTDDVIFQYALGLTDGLAPARAEDAESELAQKDDIFAGEGRASVIDWAVKDRWAASDVSRYREWLDIQEQIRDGQNLPLTVGSMTAGFQSRLDRSAYLRRRKLDNRIEWLIMTSLSTGAIAYNDGKIKFTVPWGRPTAQVTTYAAANIAGSSSYPLGDAWNVSTSDPIGDVDSIQQYIYDVYGVRITRALTSRRVLNNILRSDKFAMRSGIVVPNGSGGIVSGNPRYLIDGWGPKAAQAVLEAQTGVSFIEYDAVYRTRPVGSTTVTNNRFTPDNRIIFLPDEADLSDFDDTQIGFGKTLTSPHPAGNWTPGFYEWEKEYGVDPWAYDTGTGIKAFPVFLHMDKTFVYDVL